jgi:hypothetical protein
MPGLGELNNGGYVVGKKKFRIIFPVKNEEKMVFGMLDRNPF